MGGMELAVETLRATRTGSSPRPGRLILRATPACGAWTLLKTIGVILSTSSAMISNRQRDRRSGKGSGFP